MLPEHDNWIPSFTLFFPIRLFFYLTFIFIYSLFFSTQFALLTFLFGLRLWEHDILELRNVSTSSFFLFYALVFYVSPSCACLFLFYFSHGNLSLLFFIIE